MAIITDYILPTLINALHAVVNLKSVAKNVFASMIDNYKGKLQMFASKSPHSPVSVAIKSELAHSFIASPRLCTAPRHALSMSLTAYRHTHSLTADKLVWLYIAEWTPIVHYTGKSQHGIEWSKEHSHSQNRK